jgi:hypothetical protein
MQTVVRLMLASRYSMWMGWGPDLAFFYNDAYRPTLGLKHPWALGMPAQQVWSEIWLDIAIRQHRLPSKRTRQSRSGLSAASSHKMDR